jgi:hypothetical protein
MLINKHTKKDAERNYSRNTGSLCGGHRLLGATCFCLLSLILTTLLVLSVLLTPSPSFAAQSVTAHSDISLTATHWDFIATQKVTMSHTVTWSSDSAWEITIKSLDADMGLSDDGQYTKPLSDLEWKTSPVGSWTTMTTTDATVKTGAAGSGDFDLDYKIWLSWSSDSAGTYGCTLQFTITAQ